jgi:hypothetical protein
MANAPQLSPAEMDKLSRLAFAIAHDPKTRSHFAQLVKYKSPQDAAAFQDVFVTQQLANFKKAIDDDRLKDKMEKVGEQRAAQRRHIQKTRSYSDTQMSDMDKLYDQFGSWEAAQAVYSQRNPPENPALKPPPEIQEMGSTWEFPTVPGPDGKMLQFKDYMQNPRKYSNNMAIQMITDFKRGKLPSAFHAA